MKRLGDTPEFQRIQTEAKGDLPTCYFRWCGYRSGCDGHLDRAHLIPAQRLRIAKVDHDAIWDERAWIPACRKHHHAFDHGFLRLERSQLPEGIEDYAAEHGLGWSLDRDYGEREAAA